jgi:hypothetical protein
MLSLNLTRPRTANRLQAPTQARVLAAARKLGPVVPRYLIFNTFRTFKPNRIVDAIEALRRKGKVKLDSTGTVVFPNMRTP